MSEAVCKLEDDLCRCCHSEGTYKNLTGVYNIGGTEEIYYDMLRDTFDINLNPIPGILCVATYTICDACIEKLRDASTFKKQVLYYEDKFKDMVSKNLIRGADSDDGVEIKQEIEDEIYSSLPEDAVKVRKRSRVQSSEINDGFDWQCDMSDEDYKEQIELSKKKSKRVQKKKSKIKDELSTENNGKDCEEIAFKKKSNRVQKQKTRSKRDVKNKSDIKDEPEKDNGEGPPKKQDDYYTKDITGSEIQYTCKQCDRTFKNMPCIRQHYTQVHLKMRPKLRGCYLCPVKVPSHLRAAHMETAHGIPAPTCGVCGKKFPYKNKMLRHQKNVHMGERSISCTICDMKFFSQTNLAQHLIKHSGERMHKCDFCGKGFKWRKNLRTHIKMHLNDKRYVCSICETAFVQQTSLKYHMTKKHPADV